jgi:DNA-directed RNA polymerase subunit RPC12/RpoP
LESTFGVKIDDIVANTNGNNCCTCRRFNVHGYLGTHLTCPACRGKVLYVIRQFSVPGWCNNHLIYQRRRIERS